MKTCTRCNKDKDVKFFSKRAKSKDGLANWCKVCFADYERERYQNGDKARKDKNKAEIVAKNKDTLWKLLIVSKCAKCGETDPLVLEFDHRDPKTKKYAITDMLHLSWVTILAEIAKCDVLCANCHRRRTIKQFGWWRGSK